ncbi:hypothetical protein LTS18_003188, partial [Coniosporium uncinatum]
MALLEVLPRSATLVFSLITLVALVTWRISVYYIVIKKSKGFPLPPGPSAEPILGHLRVIPPGNPEYYDQQLSEELDSDILSFSVLGQRIIVLNSLEAAVDLLDKRAANYYDRPRFVLFEQMGWRGTLTFLRWGPRFRMHRKVLQKSFQKSNIIQYRSLQEREARVLTEGILKTPGEWEILTRRFATAIVPGIGFGIHIQDDRDPYIKMSVDASYALGHGGAPAGTLVDFFPFITKLPTWLVPDRSLNLVRNWKWVIRQIHDVPYADVKELIDHGRANPSLIVALLADRQSGLEKGEEAEMTIEDIKGAAGAVYAAGQDTTWSTLIVFILNMLLHPEVQQKAQRIIDEVVERSRLPTIGDRPKLQYVDCIVQETLRWCPVSPVGVPHRNIEDDFYKGYFILAGSFVYANARAMTHDEGVYTSPEDFNPDRLIPMSEGGLGEPLPKGHF